MREVRGVDGGRAGYALDGTIQLINDLALTSGPFMKIKNYVGQSYVREPPRYGVDRSALLRDEQHAPASRHQGGDQIRNGLTLASARGALYDEISTLDCGIYDEVLA